MFGARSPRVWMATSLRSSFASLSAACALALSLLLVTGTAAAELKDAKVREQSKEAMEDDYLAMRFKEAEKKLKKALDTCGKKNCSKPAKAQLHTDLAVVYIAGLKKVDKGKQQLKEALNLDPSVQVDPNYSTPEVDEAFASVGGIKEDPSIEAQEEAASVAEAEEAQRAVAAAAVPRNWFSLGFQQEFLMYDAERGVCGGTDVDAEQYECFRGSVSHREVYPLAGNEVKTGFGIATRRVLFGYERLFLGRISAGGRIGFAFGGRPNQTIGIHPGFHPLHFELRGSYWFGSAPFERKGLRPFAGLSAGLGEINGKATVYVFPNQDYFDRNQYVQVDAWRKTGAPFVGLQVGAALAFHPKHHVALELRVLQMFGQSGLAGAASLSYAFGL